MFNDYFNPNAAKPQGGYQPGPATGALDYGRDRATYEQMMGLQQMLMNEHLKQQSMQNQAFSNNELASSGARGQAQIAQSGAERGVNLARMANPQYAPSMVRGDIGKANEQEAQGRLAQGTVDSKIDVEKAQGLVKQWDAAAQHLEYAGATSPLAGQKQWDQIRAGLPKGLQDRFSPDYTPDTPKQMRAFVQAAQNNLAERRKLAEIKATGQWHQTVGSEHNTSNERVAQIRADAQKRDTINSFQRAVATGNEFAIYTTGKLILETVDDLTTQQRTAIEHAVNASEAGYAARRAAGQQGIGDIRRPGSTQQRIQESLRGNAGGGLQPRPGAMTGTSSTLKYDSRGNRIE